MAYAFGCFADGEMKRKAPPHLWVHILIYEQKTTRKRVERDKIHAFRPCK